MKELLKVLLSAVLVVTLVGAMFSGLMFTEGFVTDLKAQKAHRRELERMVLEDEQRRRVHALFFENAYTALSLLLEEYSEQNSGLQRLKRER